MQRDAQKYCLGSALRDDWHSVQVRITYTCISWMCVCTCVCVCCVRMWMYSHIDMCTCEYMFIHGCMCVYMCICVHKYVYVFIYVRTCLGATVRSECGRKSRNPSPHAERTPSLFYYPRVCLSRRVTNAPAASASTTRRDVHWHYFVRW